MGVIISEILLRTLFLLLAFIFIFIYILFQRRMTEDYRTRKEFNPVEEGLRAEFRYYS